LFNIRLHLLYHVWRIIAALAAATAVVGIVYLASDLFVGDASNAPWVLVAATTIALVALYEPVRVWVQASIDRYFFREPYSYQNTIRKLSREMSAILDLQSLLTHLSAAIGQTVNCETVDAYAKDFASPLYRRLASWRSVPDEASDAPVFDETSAIVLAMAEQRRYLLRDEILGDEARDARKALRE